MVVFISANSISTGWTEQSIQRTFEQLSSLEHNTVVVSLQEPPCTFCPVKGQKKSQNSIPTSVTSTKPKNFVCATNVKVVRWMGLENRDFWSRLRLALPPKRSTVQEDSCQSVAMIQNKSKNNQTGSRDSLEVLV